MTGCVKTYVVLFAEREGFDHLHFHVIPRAHDLEPRYRGSGIFGLLGINPESAVGEEQQDRLAQLVRTAFEERQDRLPWTG